MTENKFGVITNWCIYENVDGIKKWLNFDEVVDLLNDLSKENEQLKQQVEDLEFALRTKLAYQRVEKEEHSDSVYDFKKKLDKW